MWIGQSLDDLTRFEGLVFDARGVSSKSFNGRDLFLIGQSRLHRIVRKKKDDQHSDHDGDEAEKEKHDLSKPVSNVRKLEVCLGRYKPAMI